MQRHRWTVFVASATLCIAAVAAAAPVGAATGRARSPKPGGAPPAPPGESRPAPVSNRVPTNINISRDQGNESEVTIAVNPTNPNNLVAVSNIAEGGGLFKAFSLDGGLTWSRTVIADGDNLGTACCDPKGQFDSFGNYFLVYLNQSVARAQVARSTNGGATFQFLGSAQTGGVDFPGLTTGPGVLWVFWTNTDSGRFEARGVQVTGLGTIGQVGPVQVAPGSDGRSFGDGAVGPEGQFMITYQDNFDPLEGPSGVHVNVDPDGLGPSGFSPRRQVATSNVGSFDSIPAMDSRTVLASVNLEWDRSGGQHNGRVYLIYNDERVNESNDTEIVLRYSDNNGLTWSNRLRINDDQTRRSQFLPWASLDQTTGNLAVSWHDARMDAGTFGSGDTNGVRNDDAQFWAAVSIDGGTTFTNIRISAGTSNEDQAFNNVDYGDYTGLSFTNGVLYPSWADNSNSTGDNPNGSLNQFDLYTAMVGVP